MYSLDNRKKIQNKYWVCCLLFVFCLLLLLSLLVITVCLTNYQNYRYFEIIGGVFTGIFVFLSILLYAKTMDLRRLLIHFDSVLEEKERDIEAEVVSVSGRVLTLDDNIRVQEVVLRQEGVNNVYFLLTVFPSSQLVVQRRYRFLLADRFIKEIGNEL